MLQPSPREVPARLGVYDVLEPIVATDGLERYLGTGGSQLLELHLIRPDPSGSDVLAARELERAVESLSKAQGDHLVRVVGTGTQGPLRFVASQHLAGRWLSDVLIAMGSLPPEVALRVLRDVTLGLDALHGASVAHGDLRPRTILLCRDGVARLGGLGIGSVAPILALPAAARESRRRYRPPEELRAHPATPAGDLYSLGALLHELLVDLHPEAPEPLRRYASRLSSPTPTARPMNARAVLAVLERAASWIEPASRSALAKLAGSEDGHRDDMGAQRDRASTPPLPGPPPRSSPPDDSEDDGPTNVSHPTPPIARVAAAPAAVPEPAKREGHSKTLPLGATVKAPPRPITIPDDEVELVEDIPIVLPPETPAAAGHPAPAPVETELAEAAPPADSIRPDERSAGGASPPISPPISMDSWALAPVVRPRSRKRIAVAAGALLLLLGLIFWIVPGSGPPRSPRAREPVRAAPLPVAVAEAPPAIEPPAAVPASAPVVVPAEEPAQDRAPAPAPRPEQDPAPAPAPRPAKAPGPPPAVQRSPEPDEARRTSGGARVTTSTSTAGDPGRGTGTLIISCDRPCTARVDGALSGRATQGGAEVRPGAHAVIVTNRETGFSLTVHVSVPAGATVRKAVHF